MRRMKQRGQAILMVVLAMGLLLVGALGLAVDGAQIYAHHHMAQAAADAAAMAGIMSIFNSSNNDGVSTDFSTADFTCTTTAGSTPCLYARNNGFGGSAGDTVRVEFNPTVTVSGIAGLSSVDPTNLIRVTITRTLGNGLIRMLGGPATSLTKATATAAIMEETATIPIIVTHPTLPGSFQTNGGSGGGPPTLTICGGAQRSVQVNSQGADPPSFADALSFSGNAVIDLHKAGVADDGHCNTGTGGDFGSYGGPITFPSTNLLLGTTGHYIQPSSPILDPLATVPQPAVPAAAAPLVTVGTGVNGCPTGPCALFSPGLYDSSTPTTNIGSGGKAGGPGIWVKNVFALFKPGVYYINGSGFNIDTGSGAAMATGFTADPNTGQGMVVFNTGSGNGDIFNFNGNAGSLGGITLLGAPLASIYKGILFFQDRGAGAHRGVGSEKAHSIQGGGAIALTGTIYINQNLATVNDTHYQTLQLQGNAGSSTSITGEIIASVLQLGGTAGITMNLDPNYRLLTRQVALVK
jgi:hypothetical protein